MSANRALVSGFVSFLAGIRTLSDPLRCVFGTVEMDSMVTLLLPVALFFAAAVASVFGQGGGSLYTPVQLWLGIDPHVAAATSLLLIVVTSLSATLVFHRAQHTDWAMCAVLEAPTLVGALGAAFVARVLPGIALVLVLCGLLVVAGLTMSRLELRPARPAPAPDAVGRPWHWVRRRADETYCLNLLVTTPIMFAIGFATSMVGLGGGILKLPAMVLLFRVPMRIAVGSSALMVGMTAMSGLVGHISVGHLRWGMHLVWAAVAVFCGAQMGSRLSHRLSTRSLQRFFGWFLIVTALVTMARTFAPFSSP